MIDSKSFNFALMLENSIEEELAQIMQHVPQEQPAYKSVLILVLKLQGLFKLDVEKARDVDAANQTYPLIDRDTLVGSDHEWEQIVDAFSTLSLSSVNLPTIWMMYGLIEKSAQFYQQAANNSAYPSTRLFFNSLFQVRSTVRRRIGGILRILYNITWEEIGFAPFQLGKD